MNRLRVLALTCLLTLGGCTAQEVRDTYHGIGYGETVLFTPVAIVVGIPFCFVADILLAPLRLLDVSEPQLLPLTLGTVDYFFGDDEDDAPPEGVVVEAGARE